MNTPAGSDEVVPVLETERLILRGHRLDDVPACAAMWADPEVTRFISARPATEEEAWARFLKYAGHWRVLGFGYWAVEERRSGDYLGDVGFAENRRAIEPPLRAPEIGWVLAAAAAGRGFATEAVMAALAWADRHLAVDRTVCIIAPGHVRSTRVATKAGYRETGTAIYRERETTVWSRARPATPHVVAHPSAGLSSAR